MNKEKYLKELEKRIMYLTPEQKQSEIFRVSNELDSGKVINDLSVEIKEIYAKYNIDIDKEIKKSNSKFLKTLTKISKPVEKFAENIKKKTFKENLLITRDLILLIILVAVLKIPFIATETILFSVFRNNLSDQIYTIINFGLEILYIIFAISIFVKIFKKRFKEELK